MVEAILARSDGSSTIDCSICMGRRLKGRWELGAEVAGPGRQGNVDVDGVVGDEIRRKHRLDDICQEGQTNGELKR